MKVLITFVFLLLATVHANKKEKPITEVNQTKKLTVEQLWLKAKLVPILIDLKNVDINQDNITTVRSRPIFISSKNEYKEILIYAS